MKCQNLLLLASLGIGLVFSACNKMKDVSPAAPVAKSAVDSSLVLTPEGYVPAYKVHHIEKGYALMRKGLPEMPTAGVSRTGTSGDLPMLMLSVI